MTDWREVRFRPPPDDDSKRKPKLETALIDLILYPSPERAFDLGVRMSVSDISVAKKDKSNVG